MSTVPYRTGTVRYRYRTGTVRYGTVPYGTSKDFRGIKIDFRGLSQKSYNRIMKYELA